MMRFRFPVAVTFIRNTFCVLFVTGLVLRLSAATPAPDSPLDFLQVLQSGAIAVMAGSDATGNIYTVGYAPSAASILTTPGALHATQQSNVLFVRKLSPDGAKVLYAATLGEIESIELSIKSVGAKVDRSGNVYVAFQPRGSVAGVSTWSGDSAGDLAVIKIGPQGDHILSATRIAYYYGSGPSGFDIDSDGAAYFAGYGSESVLIYKIGASGEIAASYTIKETGPPGRAAYGVSLWLSLAVGPDHSVYIAATPGYVYRVDLTEQQVLFRELIGGVPLRDKAVNEQFPEVLGSAIAVDSAGSCYVAGHVNFADGTSPFPVTPVDFTGAIVGSYHAFVIKFDPSGNTIYSDAFSTDYLSAVAVDAAGGVWAAGGGAGGFTILSLDASSGGELRHYVSLPAIAFDGAGGELSANLINSLTLDSAGRALLAGVTPALQLPDSGPGGGTNSNAFFARLMADPPQADLEVSAKISPSVTTLGDLITISIAVTNHGPAPASDVTVEYTEGFKEPSAFGQVSYTPLLISCRVTGAGACARSSTNYLRLTWPEVVAGATEFAEIKAGTASDPAWGIPYLMNLSARTTSDDPNQIAANSFNSAGYDKTTRLVVVSAAPGDAVISVNDRAFTINNAGVSGIPVVANSDVTVYFPTPQILNAGLGVFQGWTDGVIDNPRVFHVGMPDTYGIGLLIHPVFNLVTGPWVQPDSPILNAASFRAGAVAPGEIVTLFGSNLGPQKLQTAQLDSSGRIATTLAGLQAFFDDVPAPIVYASLHQSSVIVPYSVAGKASVMLRIQYNQVSSAATQIAVADSAPGLFSANSGGTGPLAAFNQDGLLNFRDSPAARGDVVVLYGTGEGMSNSPIDGGIAGANPPQSALPVSVTIGGQTAQVLYAGGVSGQTAGLLQLNVRVPASVSPGLLPVVLTVGTHSSQRGGTIAVR